MLSLKKCYKNSCLFVSSALVLGYLAACPAPVPEHVGCNSNDDCIDGRICDEQSGLCLVSDAGEISDANTSSDVQAEDDARIDDATIDDAASDDAASDDAASDDAMINDAAELDAESADLGDIVDAGIDDAEAFDATDFDAELSDVELSDVELSDVKLSDTAMPDTEMPDTAPPDMGPDPHADAGPDQQVDIDSLILLSASESLLPDGAQNVVYHWAFTQKPQDSSVTLTGAEQGAAAFTANDVHGVYVIELTITVDGDELPRDSVQVSVNNRDPVADAGNDVSVYNGATAQLDASASSDPDDDTLTYSWSLADSSLGSFDDASSAMPTFTPDASADGEIIVNLTVNDGHGGTASDTVTVTVSENLPPVIEMTSAQSSNHICSAGNCAAAFSLAATVTEPEDESFDLQWTLLTCPGNAAATSDECPSGVSANFADANAASSSLSLEAVDSAFVVGDYVVRLTATDSFGNSSHADVTLTIGNRPVTGNDSSESAVHSYTGSAYICEVPFAVDVMDADGDELHVANYTVDPAGTVTPGSGTNGTFTRTQTVPDNNFLGPYTIVATVEDGFGSSKEVTVTVSCSNSAPTITGTPSSAVNVDHHFSSGTYSATYSLAGSVSDAESDPVTCQWSAPSPVAGVTYVALPKTIDSASGSVALSSSMTASTTALIATHGLSLNCHDVFAGSSKSAQVVVGNKVPVVHAGADFTVHHSYSSGYYRATVEIDGASASDPDGDPLTYAWSEAVMGSANAASTVSAATSVSPTFNYVGDTGTVGSRNYTLTVKDSSNTSASDVVKGTVDNRAPTANGGGDLSANHSYAGSTYSASFDLNSRSSKAAVSDPDGDPLSGRYHWEAVAKSGVSYLADDWSSPNPKVTAQGNTNVVGTHTMRFTVSDAFGLSDSDDVVVTGLNRAPVAIDSGSFSPSPKQLTDTCCTSGHSQYCRIHKSISGNDSAESQYQQGFKDDDGDPLSLTVIASENGSNGVLIRSGANVSHVATVEADATIQLKWKYEWCDHNGMQIQCHFYWKIDENNPVGTSYFNTVTAHSRVSDGFVTKDFSSVSMYMQAAPDSSCD